MYKITTLNDIVHYCKYFGHVTYDTIYIYPQNMFLEVNMIKSVEEVK